MKAVIYARQSSGREEESASIDMQVEACMGLARRRGYEVVATYADYNTSGRLYPDTPDAHKLAECDIVMKKWHKEHTTEKRFREGLGKLLQALDHVDCVIFYDLTRLYRPVQFSHMQSYVDSYITSHNVRLLSVKEGDVNLNDFSDSLVASIKSQVNDNQINTTREKSKQAMAKLRDAGEYFPCSRLYGIIYEGGKNRVIKVDPEKAKVIRFVFEETAKMRPYNAIIRDMNQKFAGLQLGRVFYESNFRHIAKQSFYAGYVTDSNGNLVKSKQMEGKEIISLALWQKVQEIMSRNRRAPQRRKSILHPFSQLLYCGYCGSRLIVNVDKGKECYICKSSNLQQRGDCSKARVNINLKRHSDQFIGLHNCLSPLLVLAMYREMERNDISNSKRGKLIGLQNRLSELQTRKDNFIADLPNSVLPREDFNRAVLAFRNEIAKVTKEIAEIEHAMTNKQEVHKKAKLFFANLDMILNDKLEEGVYEDLLRSSVNKIRCFNDRLEIETIYGDFTLKRYMVKQYRNFPRFTFEYNEEALKKLDVKNADIKVTYLYGNEEVAKLNVDLECMRIYEK